MIKDVEQDYLRTVLFGGEKNEALKNLRQSYGQNHEARIAALNKKLAKLRKMASQAEKVAKGGCTGDPKFLEGLFVRANWAGGEVGMEYVQQAFLKRMRHCASQSPSSQPQEEELPEWVESVLKRMKLLTPDKLIWQPQNGFPAQWHCQEDSNGSVQSFGELMYEYCSCALWKNTGWKVRQIQIIRQIRTFADVSEAELNHAQAIADAWLEYAEALLERVQRGDLDSCSQEQLADYLAECEKLGGPLPKRVNALLKPLASRKTVSPVKKKTEKASGGSPQKKPQYSPKIREHEVAITCKNANGNGEKKKSSMPDVASSARVPNDISSLRPAKSWLLFVDESGSSFNAGDMGLVAGVLCDAANPLPAQPPLHACHDRDEKLLVAGDKVIETLLNHPQCGVLVMPVKTYASVSGWAGMIASFIELVMAMLPLSEDSQKTTLKVWVENRGNEYASSKHFALLQDTSRTLLMRHFPSRASLIDLKVQVMDKNHPQNAYPDLVAHTCFMRDENPVARQRFAKTRWKGVCFLDYSIDNLRDTLADFQSGDLMDAKNWSTLLAKGAFRKPGLLGCLLNSIGNEVRNDFHAWTYYLDATVQHLSSKALDLQQLRDQLAWLKNYQPPSSTLPPRVQLLWLTSKLSEANHLGEIELEMPVVKEFQRLSELLFLEDAPLVCFAYLHLAVEQTNAFQFEGAQRILLDYAALAGVKTNRLASVATRVQQAMKALHPAIPGLRYYGQMLSSLGCHRAFLGDYQAAQEYFRQAIACFEKLSDNQAGDIDHTRAYLVTAMMDCDPDSPQTREELGRYLGGPLGDAARRLSGSDENRDMYRHHILLRYLALGKEPLAVQIYLEQAAHWKVKYGHPWELIEFYRALLVPSGEKRTALLHSALEIARDGGFTLLVIAAVILGALVLEEDSAQTDLAKTVADLEQTHPELATLYVPLKEQPARRLPPLALAQAVLPFYFR